MGPQHNHLQGVKGGGAGKPTGAAAAPRKPAASKVAQAEDRLARVLQAIDGDAQHPFVQEQRRLVEEARREEAARMSPAQKAAMLRKEFSGAYDAWAETFVHIETLSDQLQQLEDELEAARERAFDEQERVRDLKKRIGEYESQCNLAQAKPTGPQVDTSPEAQLQNHAEAMLSIHIATIKTRKGVEPPCRGRGSFPQDARLGHGDGLRGHAPCGARRGRHGGRWWAAARVQDGQEGGG